MTHFVGRCEHGTVLRQCRCPGLDKREVRVACSEPCPEFKPECRRHQIQARHVNSGEESWSNLLDPFDELAEAERIRGALERGLAQHGMWFRLVPAR